MKFEIKSGPAPVKRWYAKNPETERMTEDAAVAIGKLRDGQYFLVPGTEGLKGGHVSGKIRLMKQAIKRAGRVGCVIAYSSERGVVVKHVPSGIEGEDDAAPAPPAPLKAKPFSRK